MTHRPTWRVDDLIVRNPGGKIVATIVEDLSSIERQELIRHLTYAVGAAYHRGFEEGQREPDGILEEPDDL